MNLIITQCFYKSKEKTTLCVFYNRNNNLINLDPYYWNWILSLKFYLSLMILKVDSIMQMSFEMTSSLKSKSCQNHQESMLAMKTRHGTRKHTESWTVTLDFFHDLKIILLRTNNHFVLAHSRHVQPNTSSGMLNWVLWEHIIPFS